MKPDNREKTALIIVFLALLTLSVGLFRLQVLRHEEFLSQSERNRIRLQPEIPRRGLIYDRNGKILVENRPSYAVSLVRSEMSPDITIPLLSELIGMEEDLIVSRTRSTRSPHYLPAVIKRDVGFEVVSILEEQNTSFPGITYGMDRVRKYPIGLATECFTGYVGEVSDENEVGENGPRIGSLIGKQGIEKQYDFMLRGREGTRFLEVSAAGVVLGDLADRPPDPATPGAEITLTIDADLQKFCADVFDTFCCGAVVALDPNNGEILALVSKPIFDANIFSGVISPDVWSKILNDPQKPLLNRPLDGRYPPGSVHKLVSAGAIFEEKLVNPKAYRTDCKGGWQYGRRWFGCWKSGGHGKTNLTNAITQSCDTYFYQMSGELGINRMADYSRRCGFGSKTGIDLPQESSGLVPTTDTLDKFYPDGWTKGLALNLIIGQGELLVTPLQVAQFFAGLANHGVVYKPHLLKSTSFHDRELHAPVPEVSFRLPFSAKTLEFLNKAILDVVHSEHGTARGIARKSFQSAGKTSTAQNPHGEEHSWYAGYAPFDDPQIVVVVLVENGGHGSEVAAPMVGRIFENYLSDKADSSHAELIIDSDKEELSNLIDR